MINSQSCCEPEHHFFKKNWTKTWFWLLRSERWCCTAYRSCRLWWTPKRGCVWRRYHRRYSKTTATTKSTTGEWRWASPALSALPSNWNCSAGPALCPSRRDAAAWSRDARPSASVNHSWVQHQNRWLIYLLFLLKLVSTLIVKPNWWAFNEMLNGSGCLWIKWLND